MLLWTVIQNFWLDLTMVSVLSFILGGITIYALDTRRIEKAEKKAQEEQYDLQSNLDMMFYVCCILGGNISNGKNPVDSPEELQIIQEEINEVFEDKRKFFTKNYPEET